MAPIRWPRLPISTGLLRDGSVTTAAGRRSQFQAASTLTTASVSWSVTGSSGDPSASSPRSAVPQPMSVRRPSARPCPAV